MPDLLPIFDSRPLRDLLEMGAEPGLVAELVGLLEADVPARMAALRRALERDDGEAAIPEAHQLKGALGTMGFQRFADLGHRMEEHLRAGEWEAARSLLETFPAAYEEALAAIRMAFPEA